MSEERIISLFDFHVPFHVPLGPVFQFVEDFKPTVVVLGGDLHDWGAVSSWLADQSRALDGGLIEENYAALKRAILEPLHESISTTTKVVYLIGNHEERLAKAAEIHPNGRGYWELEKNIDLKKYNIRLIPAHQAYHVNKNLCYLHGLYTSKYHSFQTVHAVHKSVFYGHTHDVQRYTDISPVDETQFYTGASCGCLCSLNPGFLRGKPNRWVNGFNFACVDTKTEEFSEVQVYIIKNKFWANGRRYK